MTLTAEQLLTEFDDQGLARVKLKLGQKGIAVELLELSAEKKNAGLEGFALSTLTDLADESGTELLVEVTGRAGRPRYQAQAAFFARYGFVMQDLDTMRRVPQTHKN